jgi:hypothetical protein
MRLRRRPRFVRDVQRLQLQPDDVVLIRVAQHTSPAAAACIAEAVKDAVPKHRCLILRDDVNIAAIGDHPAFRNANG